MNHNPDVLILSFLKLKEAAEKNPHLTSEQAIDVIVRVIGEKPRRATREERRAVSTLFLNNNPSASNEDSHPHGSLRGLVQIGERVFGKRDKRQSLF